MGKAGTPLELSLDEPVMLDIEMEAREDIPAELEAFVRLARLGRIENALDWYGKCLQRRERMFPVLAEYAEMLLQEGLHDKLVDLLDDTNANSVTALHDTNSTEVSQLLKFMRILAIIRWKGMPPGEKLSTAMKCWDYLKEICVGKVDQRQQLSPVQIHMVEVYLGIAVEAFDSDLSRERNKFTNPPWTPPGSPRWTGFCAWYTELRKQGLHWQAQKIQGILLPVVEFEVAMNTLIRRDQFAAVAKDIAEQHFDESLVITELIASNSICEYLMQRTPPSIILAEAYLKASHSLKQVLSQHISVEDVEHARTLLRVDEL
ncbi:hypothetical protein GE09DRAFT_950782, partial [Coniochaeta sp. 2T2.1]